MQYKTTNIKVVRFGASYIKNLTVFIPYKLTFLWQHIAQYCNEKGEMQTKLWNIISTGERERLSLSAFLRTEDTGVHIVHISRLIITYTLE